MEITVVARVNKAESNLSWFNGRLHNQGNPFSGVLFTLFPGASDTAVIETYQDGREDGLWLKFYENGRCREKRTFKHGRKTGSYETWWENGQLQMQYQFDSDEYEGPCREWNAEGTLVKEMHYKKGHEEGPQRWWYDNGKIKANYVITGGRRYGLLGTKNCINVSDSIFRN